MADPNTIFIDSRIDEALDRRGGGGHHSGMDDAWRNKVDGRLDGLEKGVSELKGTVDGMKHSQTMLAGVVGLSVAVMLGGFAILFAQINRAEDNLGQQVDKLGDLMRQEFRAIRAEQSAQTSAIANAITATKQQAPQVILVPAPQVQQPASPQP